VEVDDIIQETYTRLLQTKSVEHIRNPKTYAFQTAGSVLVDRVRLLKVVPITAIPNIEQLQIMSDIPSPERQVIDREELFRLGAAIAQLPEKVRIVFKLRRIDGYSQREVAEKIGISENAVEKHMSRALLLLLRVFRDSGNDARQASSPRTPSELICHDANQESQRD
jgi:RNA polymerase sigma-70 factor (ECF subfamily)